MGFQVVNTLVAIMSAASAPASGFADAVTTAVFETCPAIINKELDLDDHDAVTTLGFEPVALKPDEGAHPRLGNLKLIMKNVGGGMLAVGASEYAFCQVQFEGESGPEILEEVRSELLSQEAGYALDPDNEGTRNGVAYKTYKKVIEPNIVSYVQLLTMPQPSGTPRHTVQMSLLEE